MWAFSEAALGGVFHLLKIPFKGLFLSGIAVVLINLIHAFQKEKKEIFKATLETLIIKGTISPHTPVNAYFAVLFEGAVGQLFFNNLKSERTASLLLAFVAGLYSAFQRVVVLTLLFGFTLWQSLDSFAEYLSVSVFRLQNFPFSFSQFLIGIYALIHITVSLYFGAKANQFKNWLKLQETEFSAKGFSSYSQELNGERKKRIFRGKLLLLFLASLFLLSYLNPAWKANALSDLIIMTLRALFLTILWYLAISPLTKKFLNRLIAKKESQYWTEVEEILKLFPEFKKALNYAKHSTKGLKRIKRIKEFLKLLILASLIEGEEN